MSSESNEMDKSRKTSTKRSTKKAISLEVSQQVPTSKTEVAEPKKSRIDKARDFLERNKIFFETIAAMTLTIMAIVLAWGQLKVTKDQTEFLKQQTIIERAQTLPQFLITTHLIIDQESGRATDEEILIYNQGNIAREIKATLLLSLN